ncbi:hypothetical protein FLJC2902T_31020 [Flavobacterium limnosediminis JC2902]|uniref:Uncharacterized protein n=1 Tax=Flavobacterium limnosediminis JC2902 TaxID=1341181 RepID=V6SFR9_9FLAO|nr:DUF6544 family protein [Flavobacterium limnosediminis]ESU25294.1 hypothetical protein FLJC2902T_31020 [Flavobacterium limnosediminis JC2902]
MMKFLLAILLILHGLIHLMGFAKAFHYGKITQIKDEISKPIGILWLLDSVLFILSAVLLLLKNDFWILLSVIALIISQILIFKTWKYAKFGALINIFLLIIVILSYGSIRFENDFKNDTKKSITISNSKKTEILTQNDIKHLPLVVQNYLKYAGAINKPKVKNMRVVFEGEMRENGKRYFPFTSEQYNFFEEPSRLFFMKGKMFGLTVPGYHKYQDGKAAMNIKLFGIFPIIRHSGAVMDKTETVTLFNDMCLLAPATLIDKRIQWQFIDDKTVKATFTNKESRISARLYFNEKGHLVNFISDDRTAMADGKQYPFSTPVSDYKSVNGIKLMSYGEAVWYYPDGKFTYGKFHLKEIQYNCK